MCCTLRFEVPVSAAIASNNHPAGPTPPASPRGAAATALRATYPSPGRRKPGNCNARPPRAFFRGRPPLGAPQQKDATLCRRSSLPPGSAPLALAGCNTIKGAEGRQLRRPGGAAGGDGDTAVDVRRQGASANSIPFLRAGDRRPPRAQGRGAAGRGRSGPSSGATVFRICHRIWLNCAAHRGGPGRSAPMTIGARARFPGWAELPRDCRGWRLSRRWCQVPSGRIGGILGLGDVFTFTR